MAATSQHRCVFVGNIPYDATEEQLIQICEEVGPVVSFRLVIDRETGKPKGYGFCEYKDEETALSARRNLQGYEINGRQLRVDFAENDKGADRNREQGRGGPGLASNVGGPAVLGDSALYQPIGLQLSATAASVMAGALGGAQTDKLLSKQNGFQGQSSLGNDQLTHYLSKMSRKQLHEVISDIKVMTTQNKELARQLLLASPQLPKALFQAAIMLGMVTPQMLQMPNLRQTPGSISQSQRQDGMLSQKPSLPPHPGQASFATNKVQVGVVPSIQESQLPSLPQNTLGSNQPPPMHFPHVSMPPRFPHPQQTQSALMLPTTVAGQSGVSSGLTPRPFNNLAIRPQPPTVDNSSLKQQMLLPFVHNPGPAVLGNNAQSILPNATPQHSQSVLPTATPQHSVLSRPPSVQASFQMGSSNSVTSLGVSGSINKQTDARLTDDKTWKSRSNTLPEHMVIRGNSSEPSSHPSKLMRLEEGRSTFSAMSQSSNATRSGPTSVLETGSLPTSRVPTAEVLQHSEKQVPQLAPEVESALLQQVMSLTAEQLSSLPPEQRQQVLQLQQMLR